MRKISKRTSNGNCWLNAKNKDKDNCDVCGRRLWISPGNQIYCDTKDCGDSAETILWQPKK